ncbi:MAG: YebC/PmpR family DNA-binding transcriptional regulator [Proteobacteria bacterium]|nr:YebC/PmpR family DNA-binding transcriptional regulator [Pseudomonadota bacterium]
MAGHSKWANIKFRKAAQDAKRGKVFTKLIREITISARIGGPDPATNPRLRTAMDKALAANMKKDTLQNAIKRGAGGLEGEALVEVRYEGYAPGGVAVLVDCLTDNRNRTVSEVRHAFTKMGGNLGTDGSVAYLFNRQGEIWFPEGADEEKLLEAALEAGADDIATQEDGRIQVVTSYENFNQVKSALEEKGFQSDFAEVEMNATNQVPVDAETAEKILKMIDMLEDLDDVQNVYSNAEIPDEVLEKMGS